MMALTIVWTLWAEKAERLWVLVIAMDSVAIRFVLSCLASRGQQSQSSALITHFLGLCLHEAPASNVRRQLSGRCQSGRTREAGSMPRNGWKSSLGIQRRG